MVIHRTTYTHIAHLIHTAHIPVRVEQWDNNNGPISWRNQIVCVCANGSIKWTQKKIVNFFFFVSTIQRFNLKLLCIATVTSNALVWVFFDFQANDQIKNEIFTNGRLPIPFDQQFVSMSSLGAYATIAAGKMIQPHMRSQINWRHTIEHIKINYYFNTFFFRPQNGEKFEFVECMCEIVHVWSNDR